MWPTVPSWTAPTKLSDRDRARRKSMAVAQVLVRSILD